MGTSLRDAFRFFCEHAGYCTPPGRAACALKLARAEVWARDVGLDFLIEPEDESYESVYGTPAPEGVQFCWVAAKRRGEVVASLGFVEDDDDRLRVVQAELAAEVMSSRGGRTA